MTDILVEENPIHIDDTDMEAIIEGLRESGFSTEVTEQSTLLKTAWWVLVLVWIGGDLSHLAFDTPLELLAKRVRKHYKERGKAPPARIDLVDEADHQIASLTIAEEDPPD